MALTLTRTLLRSAPTPLLSASTRPRLCVARRALLVRAFKDEKQHHKKQHASQHQQEQEAAAVPAPTPADTPLPAQVSPPLPLEAVPFRRMTDAMLQMQREMDTLMNQFGFSDPFFGPSPFLGGGGRAALSPFSLLDSLTSPGLPSLAPPSPSSLARAMGPLSRMVPVEVEEDEASVTITAEVPGFAKEDIKVTLDPARNLLTISGEKASGSPAASATSQEGAAQAGEGKEPATARAFITFTRSFTLPPNVDVDKDIKATAEHGVLKVVLPKVHQQEPARTERQIPVA